MCVFFVDNTPKTQTTKAKIDKCCSMKPRKFGEAHEIRNIMKGQCTECEKTIAYKLNSKNSITKKIS